jgi:hypothetical protein
LLLRDVVEGIGKTDVVVKETSGNKEIPRKHLSQQNHMKIADSV